MKRNTIAVTLNSLDADEKRSSSIVSYSDVTSGLSSAVATVTSLVITVSVATSVLSYHRHYIGCDFSTTAVFKFYVNFCSFCFDMLWFCGTESP